MIYGAYNDTQKMPFFARLKHVFDKKCLRYNMFVKRFMPLFYLLQLGHLFPIVSIPTFNVDRYEPRSDMQLQAGGLERGGDAWERPSPRGCIRYPHGLGMLTITELNSVTEQKKSLKICTIQKNVVILRCKMKCNS